MKDEIFSSLQKASIKIFPEFVGNFQVTKPQDSLHGDWSSNIALIMAKEMKKNPRELAIEIISALEGLDYTEKVEVAGAGFINIYLKEDLFFSQIKNYASGDFKGLLLEKEPKKILLEYVSSNPTGPIHVGHGRSAAFGSALANLLNVAGNNVTQEYYVNDRGLQAKTLGLSVFIRMQELDNKKIALPEGCYAGEYIKDLAIKAKKHFKGKYLVKKDDNLLFKTLDEWFEYVDATYENFLELANYVIELQTDEIKKDLEVFQVKYDNWFNESSLYEKDLIQKSIKNLNNNEVEKKDGALWFKSTNYGDEKDRVLIRDNEEPTYFASDIAYHKNKYERNFDEIINIWGADHHGYIPRVKASIESLGLDSKKLKTLLIQFVSLKEKGQKVQMSTRSGEFVELSNLIDEVGVDAARYYFLARKPEQALEFDIDLAKKTNKDNHVYYIQYAHARICSIKKELKKRNIDFNLKESLEKLSLLKETEKEIISMVNGYPEILEQCYKNNELHPLCFYLRDLSSKFHSFYNAEKIISDDKDYSDAKIALSIAIKEIINNGLRILGISCPEAM
jgi:arginyl-tRNA synthetase